MAGVPMKIRGLVVSMMIVGASLFGSGQEKNAAEADLSDNNVTNGAELYRMYCATCHGLDGKGKGPAADAMKRRPPDLTSISRRNNGRFPDFRVTHIIDGYEVIAAHGSREMPIWGDFFHDMKRDDALLKLREHNLTEYIRSIQK
jgi:mono/diheme cytochrome c family protein